MSSATFMAFSDPSLNAGCQILCRSRTGFTEKGCVRLNSGLVGHHIHWFRVESDANAQCIAGLPTTRLCPVGAWVDACV